MISSGFQVLLVEQGKYRKLIFKALSKILLMLLQALTSLPLLMHPTRLMQVNGLLQLLAIKGLGQHPVTHQRLPMDQAQQDIPITHLILVP